MIQSYTRYAAASIGLLGVLWTGYAVINRQRRVVASETVAEDKDLVAFEYGPVVYCVEAIDNRGIANLVLPHRVPLDVNFWGAKQCERHHRNRAEKQAACQ